MKFSAGSRTNGRFEAGDILVVPTSAYTRTPTFFRVTPSELSHNISLCTVGATKTKGGYIPDSREYHTSVYDWPNGPAVNTWCGKAVLWDGCPC